MTQPKFKRLMAAILSGSGGGGAQQIQALYITRRINSTTVVFA